MVARRGRSGTACFLLSVVGAASVLQAGAQGNNRSVELNIEAAYLLHFVRYVSWPNPSPASAPSPVIFGVLGHDPMVDILEEVVSGKTVNNRHIKVKVFTSTEQIDHCDILFIPRSESKQIVAVRTAVSGRPILTVSDQAQFANSGGMIEFLLIEDTVRFKINNEATESAGLKLSSELLRVAYSIAGRRK